MPDILTDINLQQNRQIEIHRKLADGYRKRYALAFSKIFQRYWNSQIIKMLPEDKNIKILDLGCGTGLLLADLLPKFKFVVGLDISSKMLEGLEGRVKRLVNASGNSLPFSDESFDVIVCRGSLHHIRFLNQALFEIKRVLKKGGVLVFSEPSNDCILIRIARKFIYKISMNFNQDDKAFLTKELKNALLKSGFNILQEERFGFFSYLFCGFPVHFPLMCYIPFSAKLSVFFKKIDMFLARVPFIKNHSFHIIIKAEK